MAIHSGVLAWKIPWTEEPGGLQFHGVTESDTTEPLTFTPLAFLNNVYAVICHQCYS